MTRAGAAGGARRAGSGNFFLSLTDLLVGILFLFILLMMTFALQFSLKRDSLEQIAIRRVAVREAMLERLQARLGGPDKVKIDAGDGVLRFAANLLFAQNSDELKPAGKAALRVLARGLEAELPCFGAIAAHPRCPHGTSPVLEAVYVEGHTDVQPLRPGGKFKSNWELSSARAVAAYRELERDAPGLVALRNSGRQAMLGASAYEAKRPVDNDPANFAENRRVEFRFLLAAPSQREIEAAGGA